jgi:hypothetical protein
VISGQIFRIEPKHIGRRPAGRKAKDYFSPHITTFQNQWCFRWAMDSARLRQNSAQATLV